MTPIVGDVLLDPYLIDRLRILRGTAKISHISIITNGIIWHRLSEQHRLYVLQSVDVLSFSVGGGEAK